MDSKIDISPGAILDGYLDNGFLYLVGADNKTTLLSMKVHRDYRTSHTGRIKFEITREGAKILIPFLKLR